MFERLAHKGKRWLKTTINLAVSEMEQTTHVGLVVRGMVATALRQ